MDLCAPRASLGADALVEALVRSGAHRYLSFKSVERTYVRVGGGFRAVASDRREMFADGTATGAEKRALMRFLKRTRAVAMGEEIGRRRSGMTGEETNVAVGAPGSEWGGGGGGEEDAEAEAAAALRTERDETMEAFLARQGLNEAQRAMVTYGLAFQTRATCEATTGMEDLKTYALSVGKYGARAGACLIPVYGAGDLPQAFCRAAAVSGATFVLRQGVRDVDVRAESVSTVVSTGGQEIRVKRVVAPAPERDDGPTLVQAVCVLDGPVVREYGEVFIMFPPFTARDSQSAVVRALQVSSNTASCPDGTYLLYLSNVVDGDTNDPYADLNAALDILVDRGDAGEAATASAFEADARKPTVLWGAMHSRRCASADDVDCAASNVAFCPGPDDLVTYKGAMRAAERAFAKLYGEDEEMFPPTMDTAKTEEASDEEAS